MNRFWAAVLLPVVALLVLRPVSASILEEPTPTVQPGAQPFTVNVEVETQGTGIPDDLVVETGFGNAAAYRHEELGQNHYLDVVQVHLDHAEMWIFEHEGNLGVGGTRNDESWELFPYIVPTPFTTTVSIHSRGIRCDDTTAGNCNNVAVRGDPPVFTLDHTKPYHIDLRVDYTRGVTSTQDYITVASTIQ